MRRLRVGVYVLSFFFLFIGAGNCAEAVPKAATAGVVSRDLRTGAAQRMLPPAQPEIISRPEKDVMPVAEGKKFFVTDLVFEGNSVVSEKELLGLSEPFVRQELSLAEIKNVTDLVERLYEKKGYFLARAYVPAQDVAKGIVKVAIAEGRLGKVIVKPGKFYTEKFIRGHFRPDLNGIIHYPTLTRSLLIMNDYPDLKAKALFQKGAEPYTVDVVVEVADKFPFHAGVDYNNFGSRYVSKNRVGYQAEYNSLVIPGDHIGFRGVTGAPSTAMLFENVNYSVPLNTNGTRTGFSYTQSDFKVGREFKDIEAKGNSKIWGAEFTHPIARTLVKTADVSVGFDYKNCENYQLGERTSNDKLRNLRMGFTGNFLDGTNARDYVSAFMTIGIKDLFGGSKAKDPEASRQGAGAKFLKFNFDGARFQKFLWDTFLLIKGSAQMTGYTLTVPEQFAIGGADSVRGYPQSEYLGDHGYQLSLEWRIPAPFIGEMKDPLSRQLFKDSTQIIGFLDIGQVFLQKALPGEDKNDFIAGMGFGLRYRLCPEIETRLDIGFPLKGKKPSDNSSVTTYFQTAARF